MRVILLSAPDLPALTIPSFTHKTYKAAGRPKAKKHPAGAFYGARYPSKDILSHRCENVQQSPRLYTHAAMRDSVLFEHAIALTHNFRFASDCKFKHAAYNIGDLGMGVAVDGADGAFFKMVFHAHQLVGVGQYAPVYAFACGN